MSNYRTRTLRNWSQALLIGFALAACMLAALYAVSGYQDVLTHAIGGTL